MEIDIKYKLAIEILQQNIKFINDRIDEKFFRSLVCENIFYTKDQQITIKTENDIIIVRNGDTPFDECQYERYKHFKKIFCQNIKVNRENVYSIPIGMESTDWTSSNHYDKFEIIKKCRNNCTIPSNLVYGNFSLWTNPQKRNECLKAFIDKEYFINDVCERLTHVSIMKDDEYECFCRKILNNVFVLCPEGNGIDTHRLWETLYLGRIPVVLHNTVNDNYQDLPILFLNEWNEFDCKKDDMIDSLIQKNNVNYEKLTFEYWKRKIQ